MKIYGLDAGSTTTKGIVLENGILTRQELQLTSGDPRKAMEQILEKLGYDGEETLLTTGYGRKLLPNAVSVTEITCHGKGASFLVPTANYVIDIGGQDSKVIRLTTKGGVLDFAMNDKCAAGTGRFVEVLMRTLGEDIEELDAFVKAATPIKINSMCTVFAESEVVSLVGKGERKADIALGVLTSIVQRIGNQFSQVKAEPGTIAFTGGLSQSLVFQNLLKDKTGMAVVSHPAAQFAGALGAALVMEERLKKAAALK